jgi:lipopolysaccharide/colanic/teichoic acid biosynthesis glycosyltransferase
MSAIENSSRQHSRFFGQPLYSRYIKRAFDIVLAIFLMPLVGLVVAVFALLTRLDGGPAFFKHERIGKDGHPFQCWKLRSMTPNSKEVLNQLLASDAAAAEEWERDRKLSNDPRITRLGRMMRASSIDELPQIWNVLRGDMSFVGPRPVTREELSRYRGYVDYYLTSKPGITGLWQVSGRNDIEYAERVRLDVEYVTMCSLWLDLAVLLRTVGAVLGRSGR